MSEYTPTTEEVREYIRAADRVTGHMFAPGADSVEAFDRWLAEVRASPVTEEPDWEYGAQHSQGTNAHPSRARAEEMVAWHAAGDSRKQLHARGKSMLVRRRKAGPWTPVQQDDGDA